MVENRGILIWAELDLGEEVGLEPYLERSCYGVRIRCLSVCCGHIAAKGGVVAMYNELAAEESGQTAKGVTAEREECHPGGRSGNRRQHCHGHESSADKRGSGSRAGKALQRLGAVSLPSPERTPTEVAVWLHFPEENVV